MSHTLDQFQTQRDVALRDAVAKLPSGDRDALLQQAIQQRYSKDRPREMVTDVSGNGTGLIPTPTAGSIAFDDGFSLVRTIEFPVGIIPPNFILEEDWAMYRTPTGLQIMLYAATPAATDLLRIAWTSRHLADGSTIPDADFEAVADYAAALGYGALAAIYAQTGDPNIHPISKEARQRYYNHLGIDPTQGADTSPAIATGSIHEALGVGLDRLTHRKASR